MKKNEGSPVVKYLEICTPAEKVQLSILHNATISTAKSYAGDATAARLKDWSAAKAALAEELEDLSLRYDTVVETGLKPVCTVETGLKPVSTETGAGSAADIPEPKSLGNKKQVFEWLKSQNRWQVSQRSVYNHAKEGRLRPGKDGRYDLAAVRRYAKNHLLEIATGLKAGENIEHLQEIKLRKEIEHRDEQIDKLRRQREIDEGKYFPTADLEMEVAARAAVLFSRISYEISTRAASWITLVDGNQERTEALIETVWSQITDLLNEFSTTREYQVVIEPDRVVETGLKPVCTVETGFKPVSTDDDDDADEEC